MVKITAKTPDGKEIPLSLTNDKFCRTDEEEFLFVFGDLYPILSIDKIKNPKSGKIEQIIFYLLPNVREKIVL